jgi:hypothetical protein
MAASLLLPTSVVAGLGLAASTGGTASASVARPPDVCTTDVFTPNPACVADLQTDGLGTTPASMYVPIQPCRLIDTQAHSGFQDEGDTLSAGETLNTPDLHTACSNQIAPTIDISNYLDEPTGSAIIPLTITAVVVNVTAVAPTEPGFLTVYGAGQSQPDTSTVNFVAGQTIANQATVATSDNPTGELTVYNYDGDTDVIVDVQGYYTTSLVTGGEQDWSGSCYFGDHGDPCDSDSFFADNAAGTDSTYLPGISPFINGLGYYFPELPFRVVDTRPNSDEPLSGQTLGPDSQISFYPGDQTFTSGGSYVCSIDDSDSNQGCQTDNIPTTAQAVVLNVTVVDPTAPSYLTVWSGGGSAPFTSNLNFPAGVTIANRVIVPLGTGSGDSVAPDQVSILNWAGDANVVVDVDGYFDANPIQSGTQCANPTFDSGITSTAFCFGAYYWPLVTPQRIADSRTDSGFEDEGDTLGAKQDQTIDIPTDTFPPFNTPSTETLFAPSHYDAVDGNLTVTDTTGSSYLTAYPSNDEMGPPTASDLNWVPGDIISNGDLISTGYGKQSLASPGDTIQVYNWAGNVDFIFDLSGYYTVGYDVNFLDVCNCDPLDGGG